MPKVWRIEGPDGFGPYYGATGDPRRYELVYARGYPRSDSQPTPWMDFREGDQEELRRRGLLFGFPSPEAAETWFGPDAVRGLAALGYHLRELEARAVIVSKSGRQVMFDAPEWHLTRVAPKPRPVVVARA